MGKLVKWFIDGGMRRGTPKPNRSEKSGLCLPYNDGEALRVIRRVLIQPFIELLRQGISPKKLALTIALGFTLGVTPVIGSTTLLCTLAAVKFRLNLPAIHLVNGVAWPLQLILLIPFLRAGAWMFGDSSFAITLAQVAALIRSGVWHAISTLWIATMHALAVWLLVASLGTGLLYIVLVPLLEKLWAYTIRSVDA